MRKRKLLNRARSLIAATCACGVFASAAACDAAQQTNSGGDDSRAMAVPAAIPIEPPVPLTSNLDPAFRPIDLNTALRLAGVQNPELNIARQRVVESVALRQIAAAQILPTLNGGMNYDNHTGVLQQSNGNILSLNRSAVYVGAGTNA